MEDNKLGKTYSLDGDILKKLLISQSIGTHLQLWRLNSLEGIEPQYKQSKKQQKLKGGTFQLSY